MSDEATLTRRDTLLGATTVAATAAFGMELPISVGVTPANAQDEHALN